MFARQTGMQIVAPGNALLGVKTPRLQGAYDTTKALSILIMNTDLVIASDDGHTIILTTRPPANEPGRPEEVRTLKADALEAITVTGYRSSLVRATQAKREAVNLTDSIYAEDIGRFPDTNIAESLNRVPGILLTRDADGEGVLIAIRGLSTNFTRILLNDSPIAVASGGVIDSSNSNREVDLNMFPSELFTSLTVDKASRADIPEGGAAGTVNMRTRRPFDEPGRHLTYVAQGIDNAQTNGMGGNGALIASDTWDSDTPLGSVGVLVGFAAQQTYTMTRGWEDGNAGWVTPSITTPALCGAPSGCDLAGSAVSIGGNAIAFPAAVPANVAIPGYPAGSPVNAAMLLALNPGLSMTQISNMLLPRLPRTMYQRGTRDRYNAVASFEMRPTESLQFYTDFVFGRRFNNLDRSDMSWGVRSGNGAQPIIPMSVVVDSNGVVTSGQFANAQFGLEARPYIENSDFLSLNPGFSWTFNDLATLDLQAYASRSHYIEQSPTIYVVTCPSAGNPAGVPGCAAPPGGVFVDFSNNDGAPQITTNINLDDPKNFQWNGGRAQIRGEKRYTTTFGTHIDFSYGTDRMRFKIGTAYDVQYRSIVSMDFLTAWQQSVCGGNISSSCTGIAGSLIPQSSLASYLYPGPSGFVSVDYDAFKSASNFYSLNNPTLHALQHRCVTQPAGSYFSATDLTNATSGCLDEATAGLFAQVDGTVPINGHDLKYDIGLRWIETRQSIQSPVAQPDGSYIFSDAVKTYRAFLPSINLVYNMTDDLQFRGAVSRTITRANATQMVSVVNFSDPTAQQAIIGNPGLNPYFSNNVDVGVEYYTGGEGYVALESFAKWISGFTTTQIQTQPFSYLTQFGIDWNTLNQAQQQALYARSGCTSDANCPAEISVELPLNAPGIETIEGLEFSFVQSLDPVLSPYGFDGLGLTGNLTLIGQSSSGSATIHATNVAPYTYNLTGYYEHGGIMARLSYAFTARTYGSSSNQQNVCLPTTQAENIGCPQGAYLFGAPYGQADFSSSIKLANILGALPSDPELIFRVQNIFDAKQHSYFQYQNAYHSEYSAGKTFLLGLHGTF